MNTKGKIMRKLLRQPVASTTSNENTDTGGNIDSPSPNLRPSASQHTIYSAGAPLSCLDRSPDGQRAVIAGAKTFKILKIDESTITEDVDLRTIISSYAASHDLSAATPDQLNIRAIQWSHGTLDTTIVTASGNGRITIYDLNRAGEGLEVARIQEHARQVHKLAINPFKNSWLLSASQDGTVKSFDLRSPMQGRHGPTMKTMKSLQTYKCNADAVRDVEWSSMDGYEFACCTDSGAVLKWDSRKPSAPVLKIAAHPSSCSSISWHPDGVHLVSGGIDLLCYVWDMSADRNQKPRFAISTPAPVSRVSWRPACWSATAQGKRAAQVTVSYDDSNTNRNQNASVHLWDLARPALPFKVMEQWDSAPTGILWNSRDTLWSVDKAGRFIQTDVAFVPQLIDRRSLSEFAFSPTGDVLMLLEERQPVRRPRPSITTPEASPSFPHGSGPLLSVSRSDSEEDVVGSFLGPRQRKGYRRRNSARSVHTISTTPPSLLGMTDTKSMSLEEAVKVTGPYKPQQIMAIGHAPTTAKRVTYKYFSNRYLQRLSKDLHITPAPEPMNIRMSSIMESFARSAEDIRHYRLAQTWRLLGFTINLLLTRRADHHRNYRMTAKELQPQENEAKEDVPDPESMPATEKGEETPRRIPRPRTPLESPPFRSPRHTINEDIESTSNVATPLVRPIRDHIVHKTREAMETPMVPDGDDLRLPDPVHTPAPIPVPGARQSPSDSASSIDGYDFYGMGSLSPSLEYVAPPRKPPLRLDYHERRSTRESARMEPKRHDSGESFQMFSSSAESRHGKLISSSGSDGHSDTKELSRSLRDKVSSWENNFEGDRKHRPSIDSEVPTVSDISEGRQSPDSAYDGRGFHRNLPRNSSSPPVFRVKQVSEIRPRVVAPVKIRHHDEPTSPTFLEKHSGDPEIIETDFLPWPNDPDFLIRPIDPTVLVHRVIAFETQTGVLNAATMLLLLRPLLPKQSVDDIQAAAILRQYHHRLTCLNLFTEAALLRNVCAPMYPSVFAPAQERVTIGFFCTGCHKPLENDPLVPGSMWKCPRCRHDIAPCAICLHRDLPPTIDYSEQGITSYSSVWWLCPGCGHGGHTSCMQAWHAAGSEGEEGDANYDGCCPLEGCLHPCLPGKWRGEKLDERKAARAKEMESAVRENSRRSSTRSAGMSGVRRDAREVNQSKAVEGVRVALGVTGLSGGGGLERKKSVKLVAPGEEM